MIQSVSSHTTLAFIQSLIDISLRIVFIPELKNGDRRIKFLQHLQNVVAPNLFNPRIVYDGRALAYSPGRVLPLAGGTGETVSFLFYLAECYSQSNLHLSSQFSVSLYSNTQVPPESKGSFQIRFTQTSGIPIQPT